jgi:hypothetical protein
MLGKGVAMSDHQQKIYPVGDAQRGQWVHGVTQAGVLEIDTGFGSGERGARPNANCFGFPRRRHVSLGRQAGQIGDETLQAAVGHPGEEIVTFG